MLYVHGHVSSAKVYVLLVMLPMLCVAVLSMLGRRKIFGIGACVSVARFIVGCACVCVNTIFSDASLVLLVLNNL